MTRDISMGSYPQFKWRRNFGFFIVSVVASFFIILFLSQSWALDLSIFECLAKIRLQRMLNSKVQLDAAVHPMFKFDGSTSDIAQQFYIRYLSGAKIEQLPIPSQRLPERIQYRLSTIGLSFEHLNGYLQRAVIWDSGYAMGGDTLRKIYTKNGISMENIAISAKHYRQVNCSTISCTVSDVPTSFAKSIYRSDFCRGEDILKVSSCATEGLSGTEQHLSIWATGGSSNFDPEPYLVRQAWFDSTKSKSYIINGIHTVPEGDEPAYGKCPRPGTSGSIIIPCAQYTSDLAANWVLSSPKFGNLTSLWLNKTKAAQTRDMSLGYIVVLTVICLLLVSIILFFTVQYRKRCRMVLHKDFAARSSDARCTASIVDVLTPSDHMSILQSSRGDYVNAETTTPRDQCSKQNIDSCDELHITEYTSSVQDGMAILFSDENLRDKHIPIHNIKFVQVISKGAYGEVWQCQYRNTLVAVKRLLQNKSQTLKDAQIFITEIQLSAALQHPNIVTFIGVAWSTLENLCMMLELCTKGDLQTYLRTNGDLLTWARDKIDMAIGIAKALQYLHSHSTPIIHRDVKAKNVLLTNELQVKLTDFGVSRVFDDQMMTAGVGTPYWTAPEVLHGTQYSEKSDMYSFGVLLSELDTCQIPYSSQLDLCSKVVSWKKTDDTRSSDKSLRPLQILNAVIAGTLQPRFSDTCPKRIRRIATMCFAMEATERPSATKVIQMLEGLA